MKPADDPVVTMIARRIDIDAIGVAVVARDPRAQRGNAERFGIAEPAGVSAARAAAIAVDWRRRRRLADLHVDDMSARASIRAAAAITSITMNGGTSLRAEGVISRFATSSIVGRGSPPPCRRRPAPLLPYSTASVSCWAAGGSAGTNSPVPAQWGGLPVRARPPVAWYSLLTLDPPGERADWDFRVPMNRADQASQRYR